MKYKEIPINKLNEAILLLKYGNPIVRLGHNEHNYSKPVYYFNGTNKFFKDWDYIKSMN